MLKNLIYEKYTLTGARERDKYKACFLLALDYKILSSVNSNDPTNSPLTLYS
jgi:hypothetical protein